MNCTAFGLIPGGADPARARVPADEDERAGFEPRDGVREVPERRHRAAVAPAARLTHDGAAQAAEEHGMRRARRRRIQKPAELLLVPMIDIFSVLVTFLLMTAVFSRITILELDLPSSQSTGASRPCSGSR